MSNRLVDHMVVRCCAESHARESVHIRVGKRLWAIIEEQIVLDQDVEGNKGAGGSDEGSTLSEWTAHKSTSTGQSD